MSVTSSWDVSTLTTCSRGKSCAKPQESTNPKIKTKKKKKPEVNFPNTGLFEMARFK
jgi:hypothetical protein